MHTKIPAALLALLLTATSSFAAAASDFEGDLRRVGFVRGIQDDTCFGPLYAAEFVNGNLVVRDAETQRSRRSGTPLLAGKSVRYEARNEGEFGGQLTAVLKSGERRLMLKGNMQSLVPLDKNLYVFEGLSHLSMSTGSIYIIRDYDEDPKPQAEPMPPNLERTRAR